MLYRNKTWPEQIYYFTSTATRLVATPCQHGRIYLTLVLCIAYYISYLQVVRRESLSYKVCCIQNFDTSKIIRDNVTSMVTTLGKVVFLILSYLNNLITIGSIHHLNVANYLRLDNSDKPVTDHQLRAPELFLFN